MQNVRAAATTATIVGVPTDAICRGVEAFRPLPHRLQFVAEVEGRRFYNDSKSTTPEAAVAALNSFREPVVLLAGGSDKGVDLRAVAETIGVRAKAAALMGRTGRALATLLDRQPCLQRRCRGLSEAFDWAVDQSVPGDVILLSPGCASYGCFRNYVERGERFIELVRDWARRRRSAA